jgi:hypothetical protein
VLGSANCSLLFGSLGQKRGMWGRKHGGASLAGVGDRGGVRGCRLRCEMNVHAGVRACVNVSASNKLVPNKLLSLSLSLSGPDCGS